MFEGFASPERVCNEMLFLCYNPLIKSYNLKEDVDGILKTKPVLIQDDSYIDTLYFKIHQDDKTDTTTGGGGTTPSTDSGIIVVDNDKVNVVGTNRPIIRGLQISDIHIDPKYEEG